MGTFEIVIYLIAIVVIIGVIIFIYNYLSNQFTSIFNWGKNLFGLNPPKPCGGDCYNDQICDLQLNKCRQNCKTGETYDTTADICCNITTHEIIGKVCVPKCPSGQ